MATYKFDKIEYNGNTYVVSDSEALPLTGGQVTGPVTFGDTVSIDEATVGDLVVNGSASFTNNIQANTISGDLTGDVTGNVVGNVSGSAGTAGAFTSAKSVTLTGDVTGSASSTGGWSIATTVKDDSHNHTADTIMVPKITKSYTGVIASANNHDNAALYCIKIVPNSYAGQWYLRYRVYATIDGVTVANGNGYEESFIYISGMRNTYATYRTWNNIANTSYRPYYYHSIYRAKAAGATTYGHVMGINLYSSYNPTNTTYKRNVTFEILDYGGCTISFFDAPTKYANIPGTGSTNYDGRTDFDGTTQGNTMSGDRNTTITYGTLDYYFRPYAGQALYRYKYVMQGEDNRIYPITVTNQTDATQVAKVPTTVGLRPWKIWWYTTTTTINAGALIGGQVLQETGYTTSAVYNFNTDIPTYRMIYLKGTYNATKDLFYLYNDGSSPCTSYYTLVPNNTANITLSNYFTEGYYYILLGASYSSANYVTLFGNHPLYYFDGTNLRVDNVYATQSLTGSLSINDSTGVATLTGLTIDEIYNAFINKIPVYYYTNDGNQDYPGGEVYFLSWISFYGGNYYFYLVNPYSSGARASYVEASEGHGSTSTTITGDYYEQNIPSFTSLNLHISGNSIQLRDNSDVLSSVTPSNDVYVVTFTHSSGNDFTADKSYSDITTAYNAGKIVYGKTPEFSCIYNSGYFRSIGAETDEIGYRIFYYMSYVSGNTWTRGYLDATSPYLDLSGNRLQLKQGSATISYVDLPIYNGGVS